jgi:hypothetical protein
MSNNLRFNDFSNLFSLNSTLKLCYSQKREKNFIKSILALGIDLLFSFGLSKTYFLRLK